VEVFALIGIIAPCAWAGLGSADADKTNCGKLSALHAYAARARGR